MVKKTNCHVCTYGKKLKYDDIFAIGLKITVPFFY